MRVGSLEKDPGGSVQGILNGEGSPEKGRDLPRDALGGSRDLVGSRAGF